jgi:DNA-binding transcriptional MerR regulator
MRIAELSRRSGTSIPSIKYYVREELLPAGTATSRNQAEYGDDHLRRLRLIRALIDVGGLSVAAARQVLATVDTPEIPAHYLLGVAHQSLHRPVRRDRDDPQWQAARAEVVALTERRGWMIDPESAGMDDAADAIAALRALGQDDLVTSVDTYAEAVEMVAARELDAIVARAEPLPMVEGVITGTILGGALLTALRLLAQQDASCRRLGPPPVA